MDTKTSNFSSSPHRLPTLSASQALQNLSSPPRKPISSGLKRLDAILQGWESSVPCQEELRGGLSRGQVTEIYGPPGVGKTTFALQVSASALHSGSAVVWVAASSGLSGPRLENVLTGFRMPEHQTSPGSLPTAKSSEDFLDHFHYFTTPTLPHLLTLLTHQSSSFPPPETGLIVVDSISALFVAAFPRVTDSSDDKPTLEKQKKNDSAQWASSRRWTIMGDLISKLGKLAVTKNTAILLTSQVMTRIRMETGAIVYPAVSGNAWDGGISARIVLFRDWLSTSARPSQAEHQPDVRFAGVLKAGGISYEGIGKVVTLVMETHGLHEVNLDYANAVPNLSPVLCVQSQKRKRDKIDDSISEDLEVGSDEEFGGGDDDNPLIVQDL